MVKKIEKFAKLKIVDRHLAVYEIFYPQSGLRSTIWKKPQILKEGLPQIVDRHLAVYDF